MNDINQDLPIEENKIEEVEEKEVSSDALKTFLGEDIEKGDKLPETPEKPQEDTVLEVETPEKEEVKEPEVPLEEITEEIKQKTKEEVKDEILKALGMTKEEKEVAEETGYKFPWEKRGEEAPKDWKEVIDASLEYQEFKKVEEDKVISENERQQLAVQQEREAAINTEWDSQLAYLREQKLIPEVAPEIQKKISEGKVLTLQEREDAGLKAQAGIFETMFALSQERERKGLGPITDVVHIYNRFYKKPEKPVGANAPVSGGSIPMQGSEEEDIPYEKLASSSFEDLVK